MARLKLDGSALFALEPMNARARQIVDAPENNHLRIVVPYGDDVLQIGSTRSRANPAHILATMNRNGDVNMGEESTRAQCTLILDRATQAISLQDNSEDGSSQLSLLNRDSMGEVYGRRGTIMTAGVEYLIKLGNDHMTAVFAIRWCGDDAEVARRLKARKPTKLGIHPSQSPTPVKRKKNIAAQLPIPRKNQVENICSMKNIIGGGKSCRVRKAELHATREVVAIKLVKQPKSADELEKLKLEIVHHFESDHVNIIECLGVSGLGDADKQDVSITFDYAEQGSLFEFTSGDMGNLCVSVADSVLKQLLDGFCYLHNEKGLVHRDIEPTNVLVKVKPGHNAEASETSESDEDSKPIEKNGQNYLFLLADFGLAAPVTPPVRGLVGHPAFMAPEVRDGHDYTDRSDMWSLLATVLWVLDCRDFRELSAKEDIAETSRLVEKAAGQRAFWPVKKMGSIDPNTRFTAEEARESITTNQWTLTRSEYLYDNPAPSPMKGIQERP